MIILAFLARHPILRSLLYVILSLIILPFFLTYHLTARTTSSYNVCFVGPAPLSTPHQHPDYVKHIARREAMEDLYGMYRTFDRASYYYVKTPFDVTPLCLTGHLWGCGWPSAVSVATTLSPRQVRHSKQGWRSAAKTDLIKAPGGFGFRQNRGDHKLYDPGYSLKGSGGAGGTTSSTSFADGGDGKRPPGGLMTAQITWDRSPSVGAGGTSRASGMPLGMQSPYGGGDPFFSESITHAGAPGDLNRWCLSSTYLREGGGTTGGSGGSTQSSSGGGMVGGQPASSSPSSSSSSSTKIKICTEEVPSIVADPAKPPYFNELPLGPPPDGVWAGLEQGYGMGMRDGGGGMRPDVMSRFSADFGDMNGGFGDGMRPFGGPAGKYEQPIEAVEVKCYVQQSHSTINEAATGAVAAGPMDESKGLSQPASVTWNPIKLPGTILLIGILLWRYWQLHYREDDDDEEVSDIFTTRRSNSTRSGLHFVSTIIRENALIPSHMKYPYPELYRLLTSPIAHSSIPSLVFSLLGIYWMGATNEVDFGTIPFLSLNISMAIFAGLASLLLVQAVSALLAKYIGSFGSIDTLGPVVMGYSPVIFAWMVIASLERPMLHMPVPGLPLAVPTITLLYFLPFNALIPVALIVARCMEGSGGKRSGTSLLLLGNIAGIIVGFFVHMGVPPADLLVPHLVIPIGLVVHVIVLKVVGRGEEEGVRRSTVEKNRGGKVGYGYADTANSDDDVSISAKAGVEMGDSNFGNHGDEDDEDDEAVSILAARPISNSERNFLPIVRLLLFTASILSVGAFDHGLALGQIGVAILYHLGVRGRLSMDVGDESGGGGGWNAVAGSERNRPSTTDRSLAAYTVHLLRCTLLSITAMILADAMSTGSWIVSYIFITADKSVTYNSPAVAAFIGLRLLINLFGLVSDSALLGPHTSKGVAINIGDGCTAILGPVFSWAKMVGEGIL